MAYSCVQVRLELGHKAAVRTKATPQGFTHDWEVFVRGPEGTSIQHFVEKVVFNLHESFSKPKRVLKEPPFLVKESGYAGFVLPIEVHFRNKDDPKKVKFDYDLFLQSNGPPINHIRCEKLTFQNPTEDFRRKLIKGGGVGVMASEGGTLLGGEQAVASPEMQLEEYHHGYHGPGKGKPEPVKRPKPLKEHKPEPKLPKPTDPFAELFGPPIKATKYSPEPKKTKTTPVKSSVSLKPSESADKVDKHRSSSKSPILSHKETKKKVSAEEEKIKERSAKSAKRSLSPPKLVKEETRKDCEPKNGEKSEDKEERKKKEKRHSEHRQKKEKVKESDKHSDKHGDEGKKNEKNMKEHSKEQLKEPKDKSSSKSPKSKEKEENKEKEKRKHKHKKDKDKEKSKKENKDRREKEKDKVKVRDKDKSKEVSEKKTVVKSEVENATKEKENVSSLCDSHHDLSPLSPPSPIMSPVHKKESPRTLHQNSAKQNSTTTVTRTPLKALLAELSDQDSIVSPLSSEDELEIPKPKSSYSEKKFEDRSVAVSGKGIVNKQEAKVIKEHKDREVSEERKESGKGRQQEKSHKLKDIVKEKVEGKIKEEPKEKEKKRKKNSEEKEKVKRINTNSAPPPASLPPPPPLVKYEKVKEEKCDVNERNDIPVLKEETDDPTLKFTKEYISELQDLQQKIMTLEDREELQRIVDVIEETGQYEVTSSTFDFDLCALDSHTVRRLQECLAAS